MNEQTKKLLYFLLVVIFVFLISVFVLVKVKSIDTSKLNFNLLGRKLDPMLTNLNIQAGVSNNDDDKINLAFNSNNFAEANKLIDEKLKANQANIVLLLQKATILAQEGSITFKEKELGDEARVFILKALEIDSKNTDALTLLGYTYEIEQDYVSAHKYYDQALAVDSNYERALSQKAHAYYLQGDTANSQKYYELAVNTDRNSKEALSGLAKIYAQLGRLKEAKDMFVQLGDRATNARQKSESYYSAAVIAENIKPISIDEMETLTDKAIQADPTYAMPYVENAKVIFARAVEEKDITQKNSMIDMSFSSLEQAIKLNPNQSIAHFQLATTLFYVGQIKDSKQVLKNMPAIIEKDISLSKQEKAYFNSLVIEFTKKVK